MKLLTLKCPSCGGQLSVEKGREYTFCQYCGTKILFDKDNEFTYRHIDDADIKRAETERIVRISELEMEKDNRGYRKVLIVAWAAGTFFLFILGIILVAIGREGTVTAGMMAMMAGMAYCVSNLPMGLVPNSIAFPFFDILLRYCLFLIQR